jgi:hypothetical protein
MKGICIIFLAARVFHKKEIAKFLVKELGKGLATKMSTVFGSTFVSKHFQE